MSERLDRINELARKAREQGLTEEETQERDRLRKEYLAAFRANLEGQLDNTYVMTPDGEKRKLNRKAQ